MSETLKDKVSQALQELPKNAECIAAFFEKEGIEGIKGSPGFCPIANFLKKKIGQQEI